MTFLATFFITFLVSWVAVPIFLFFVRLFGIYTVVEERTAKVYVLFGKVVGVIDEPGLHILITKLGLKAPLVNWIGKCYTLDLSLDQVYLRSQPVNSEEGAPMGIGVWYEMHISDPVDYLFENADPRGSLQANVSNSTVRSLSNMPLEDMLVDRHSMSHEVRGEVTPLSDKWGFKLGSVYIRKVHFRDHTMMREIEEKVVNRLRQVTSAIRQDGANRVDIITSSAERKAAVAFAEAAALRPKIVGESLEKIGRDPEVAQAMFEVLEAGKLVDGEADITFLPAGGHSELLADLLAARDYSA